MCSKYPVKIYICSLSIKRFHPYFEMFYFQNNTNVYYQDHLWGRECGVIKMTMIFNRLWTWARIKEKKGVRSRATFGSIACFLKMSTNELIPKLKPFTKYASGPRLVQDSGKCSNRTKSNFCSLISSKNVKANWRFIF